MLRLLIMIVATPAFAQRGFVDDAHSRKYAAWSVVSSSEGSIRAAIGSVSKHHANPVLV